MGYEEFKAVLSDVICRELGRTARVEFRTVHRVNSDSYEGMLIFIGRKKIWPVLPAEELYNQYGEGRIKAQEIMDIVREEAKKIPRAIKKFLRTEIEEESVLGKIFAQIVSYDRNREWLRDAPHKRFLDMAVIYYFKIKDAASGKSYIIHICNGEMEKLGVSCGRLEELAWENMGKEQRPVIKDLEEQLGISAEEKTNGAEGEPKLYTLSTESRQLGAVYMTHTDILKEFAEKVGDDLYLIPSSTHEVLLLPKQQGEWNKLSRIVRIINRYGLDSVDFLSNEIYGYDRRSGEVYICKQTDGT